MKTVWCPNADTWAMQWVCTCQRVWSAWEKWRVKCICLRLPSVAVDRHQLHTKPTVTKKRSLKILSRAPPTPIGRVPPGIVWGHDVTCWGTMPTGLPIVWRLKCCIAYRRRQCTSLRVGSTSGLKENALYLRRGNSTLCFPQKKSQTPGLKKSLRGFRAIVRSPNGISDMSHHESLEECHLL